MQVQRTGAWHRLPIEMKIAITDHLSVDDANIFSRTNKESYILCLSITFKVGLRLFYVITGHLQRPQHVRLPSFEKMQCFLAHVPKYYCRHVQQLDICTTMNTWVSGPHPRTDAVVSLLNECTRLEMLSLQLCGSLALHVIPCFSRLEHLRELSVSNCGPDPLYVSHHFMQNDFLTCSAK